MSHLHGSSSIPHQLADGEGGGRKGQAAARTDTRVVSTVMTRPDVTAAAEAALLPVIRRTSGPVLLTVLTSVTEDWRLGVSAALRGLPLIIVGLGLPSWDPSNQKENMRLPLMRRALRIVDAVAPDAKVLVLDGMDTVVANAPVLAKQSLPADTVLVSGECNSWPKCYYQQYVDRDPGHATCARERGACYANSGAFFGRSAALLKLVSALQSELRALDQNASSSPAERSNDQAALHRLYARGGHAGLSLQLRVDSENEQSLNLWACRGPRLTRYYPDIEQCHEREWDPLAEMRAVRSGVRIGSSRPLVVHANGDHGRMMWSSKLTGVLRPLVRPRGVILEHPVLLVQRKGATVSTLGQVLATASAPSRPPRSPSPANATSAPTMHPEVEAWLAVASAGHCGPTTEGDPGDCGSGHRGTWPLVGEERRTWAGAAAACLRRCHRCLRCRFVSISLWSQDCSWYAACSKRHDDIAGFLSAPLSASPAEVALARPPTREPATAPLACGGHERERSSASVAASWLVASRDGHCGTTQGFAGDCETSSHGSWELSTLLAPSQHTLQAAVAACLRRCSDCARCKHVSVSLPWNDCSWYARCDALHPVPAGFHSGALALWRERQCSAPLPPIRSVRTANQWLGSSVEGFCGVTSEGDAHSCDTDDAGTWSLRDLGVSAVAGWRAAASSCLRRCRQCGRCRHVSLSLLNEECSWYASCDRLLVTPTGYRTAALEKTASSVDGPSSSGVSPATATSDLEQAMVLLESVAARRSILRNASRAAPLASPIVLLGVFSGSTARRAMVRCTWGAKLRERSGGAVRLRFVVGAAAGERLRELQERAPDELVTPVRERQMVNRTDHHRKKRRRGREVLHGTITKQLKMIHFLRWSVQQPQRIVALADDDVFISVGMLTATARLMVERMDVRGEDHLYAGRMEWYSWHERTLVSSGWSQHSLSGALRQAQEPWRNCSPTGAGWSWTGWAMVEARASSAERASDRDTCIGPFAFAKGPLALLSAPAVEWLVARPEFGRDAKLSEAMSRAGWHAGVREHPQLLLEQGSRSVLEDVQLGFWLAASSRLRVVQLPREMWADGLIAVRGLQRLLVVHQVAWKHVAWLTAHTDQLWAQPGAHVWSRWGCFGTLCTSSHCAHHAGQRACGMQVAVKQRHDCVFGRAHGTQSCTPASASCRNCECTATDGRGHTSRSGTKDDCGWDRAKEPVCPLRA